MRNFPSTIALIVSSVLCIVKSTNAQQFKLSDHGPLVFRTNHSVTKVISITRTDTSQSTCISSINASVDQGYSANFSVVVDPTPIPFVVAPDSTLEVAVTFYNSLDYYDTTHEMLYLYCEDSIFHVIDSVALVGIMDPSGSSDNMSDFYDSLEISDSSEFLMHAVGDTCTKSIVVTNGTDVSLDIDSILILGNSHSCFTLSSSLGGILFCHFNLTHFKSNTM